MVHDFSRIDRVSAQIQRELALVMRDELNDPRIEMVTVQAVKVAQDLSHAKVYVTFLSADKEKNTKLGILNGAARFLRGVLARRMTMRTVPELHFVYDESIERGTYLTSLIEQAVGKSKGDEDEIDPGGLSDR